MMHAKHRRILTLTLLPRHGPQIISLLRSSLSVSYSGFLQSAGFSITSSTLQEEPLFHRDGRLKERFFCDGFQRLPFDLWHHCLPPPLQKTRPSNRWQKSECAVKPCWAVCDEWTGLTGSKRSVQTLSQAVRGKLEGLLYGLRFFSCKSHWWVTNFFVKVCLQKPTHKTRVASMNFSSCQLIDQCHVNHKCNNPIREQMGLTVGGALHWASGPRKVKHFEDGGWRRRFCSAVRLCVKVILK